MLQGVKMLILNAETDGRIPHAGHADPAALPAARPGPVPADAPRAPAAGKMNGDADAGEGGAGRIQDFNQSIRSAFSQAAAPAGGKPRESIESIWRRYAPQIEQGRGGAGGGGGGEEKALTDLAATNARLDRLEAVSLHLCEKVGLVLCRIDDIAAASSLRPDTARAGPGPPGRGGGGDAAAGGMRGVANGLVSLTEAPLEKFRSSNLMQLGGLRSALGLGVSTGDEEGRERGGSGVSTQRDALAPSAAATSPRLMLPRSAEEAWEAKAEARVKRRARRAALEQAAFAAAQQDFAARQDLLVCSSSTSYPYPNPYTLDPKPETLIPSSCAATDAALSGRRHHATSSSGSR